MSFAVLLNISANTCGLRPYLNECKGEATAASACAAVVKTRFSCLLSFCPSKDSAAFHIRRQEACTPSTSCSLLNVDTVASSLSRMPDSTSRFGSGVEDLHSHKSETLTELCRQMMQGCSCLCMQALCVLHVYSKMQQGSTIHNRAVTAFLTKPTADEVLDSAEWSIG